MILLGETGQISMNIEKLHSPIKIYNSTHESQIILVGITIDQKITVVNLCFPIAPVNIISYIALCRPGPFHP